MKRNIVIASVTAAALLTGGTAVAVASTTGAPTTHPTNASGTTARTSTSFSEAAQTALKAVPGTLDSLDRDHGARTTWDAEILGKDGKWHEVTLDASNGKVLNQHIDRDTDA